MTTATTLENEQASVPSVWLSVIVPVHNEGAMLAKFLAELKNVLVVLAPEQHEIIVVDDASTDCALNNCVQGAAFRIVRLPARGGSGAARKRGVAIARGNVIAWIDGDGTYDPQSLTSLVGLLENADQVIGARRTDHGWLKWLRLAVKRSSFLSASLLWWHWIPDLNSGFRIFRRECMQAWLDELPNGFSCTSTATLAALNHRQRVAFAPIPYQARSAGTCSKFHPVRDTFRFWRTILKLWLWPRTYADRK